MYFRCDESENRLLCYQMAALVEKQSDWPVLNVIDPRFVQSPSKDFVVVVE